MPEVDSGLILTSNHNPQEQWYLPPVPEWHCLGYLSRGLLRKYAYKYLATVTKIFTQYRVQLDHNFRT